MTLDLKQVPQTPGIYKFFAGNKIIYIGKAINLKKRVSSYFGSSIKDRKTSQIKLLTDRVETFSTQTEAEALLLEQSLIKENLPRFNILLRDDKTYPYIHYSMGDKFPSISMKRSKHAVSKDYFGPFISAYAVKSTIKDLQKIYQIRNCSNSTFRNRSRPCIEYQMQRCSAPCVEQISKIDYSADISSSQNYLASTGKKSRKLMLSQMKKLADECNFEKAQELKQRIASLDILQQEQSFSTNLSSIDFFACVEKHGKTGACILSARDGKIRGTKTYFFKENLLDDPDNLLQSLVFSYYQNTFSLPEKIIFTLKPNNLNLIEQAIKLKFYKSINISCSTPSSTKQLVKLAIFNANQVIENKIGKSDKYDHAMKNLSRHLGLDKTDLLIEGYDVSHHAGKYAVASLVKFSNQGPEKKLYKLYNIPALYAGNDIGSLQNVLARRVNRAAESPLPDIILIDGGVAQLNAALRIVKQKHQPIILSIVKGANRVRATETILSKQGLLEIPVNSPGFNLLQQIRDESHRFAITNNRKKKNQSVRYSALDQIHGLGLKRKQNLLNHFKSLKSISAASLNELCTVQGISIKLGAEIQKHLKKK
ncbi:excinuclease ABC subunit UvrC [Gammaproteobacteria bacterium]|jgi:excinuclease ABC subunit C|nr:excinuclease ABC subunit UvrC [Gammaproteobacteria bacterium]MDC0129019.1 excinuclease ABC subunit UvrC [Gammaproteobacteria bacterium]